MCRALRSGCNLFSVLKRAHIAELIKLQELVGGHKNQECCALHSSHDIRVSNHVLGELVALEIP